MYKMMLSGVLGGLLTAGAASAAVLPTTVSATGSYHGDLAVLNDGIVPANGSVYNTADKVSFTAAPATFRFDFGKAMLVDSLFAAVDNNDTYIFSAFNGAAIVGNAVINPGDGSVGFGVESFTFAFPPITATHFLVTAQGGDAQFSIGEVQFTGTVAGGVPEPAIWAMMFGGFGLIGATTRRRARMPKVAA